MRCPKCGYISFDDLELCKKCKKNITETVRELNGTAFHAEVPLFLQMLAPQARPRESFIPAGDDPDSEMGDSQRGDAGDDIRDGIDTEFVLDDITLDDIPAADGGKGSRDAGEEIMLDMDELDEKVPRDEFTLDLDADQARGEIKMPAIDFGDMDISDLAPPVVERTKQLEPEKEFALAEEGIGLVSPMSPPPPPKAALSPSSPLEDLQFNDLNLDMPTKIVASNTGGKSNVPSIKTGTALDSFEVDLGELFAETKK